MGVNRERRRDAAAYRDCPHARGGEPTCAQRRGVETELALAGLGVPPPGVTVTWARLPREAVTDLVGFLQDGSPLRDLLDELGSEASRAVRDALVAGVATG